MSTNASVDRGWRTVDIVVAAVLAVVFGVVFWQWGVVWAWAFTPPANPLAYLVSGMWLVPGVLAALIIRRPGAALLTEALAGLVSAFLGSVWGLDTVLSGVAQGLGAELIFAVTLYRSFGPITAALAGGVAAVGEWLHDTVFYFAGTGFDVLLAYGGMMIVSGVLIAGLGSWLLVRALLPTGVLAGFPAGRGQARI
jgi:energy-coupling factor transport system substrate-specific component